MIRSTSGVRTIVGANQEFGGVLEKMLLQIRFFGVNVIFDSETRFSRRLTRERFGIAAAKDQALN